MPASTQQKGKKRKPQEGYTFPGNPDVNSSSVRQVGTGFFSIRSKAAPEAPGVSYVTVVQAVTLEIPDNLAEDLSTREVLAGLYGALYVAVPIGTFATQKLAPVRSRKCSAKSRKREKSIRVPVK